MATKKETGMQVYTSSDGKIHVDVRLDKETIRLNQEQIGLLFGVDRTVITKHVGNIYKTLELSHEGTSAIFAQVQSEGKRIIKRSVSFYNLDMILSIGYRVNSMQATQFRIRATNVLKHHIIQGHTINQKRLQEVGFDELDRSVQMIKNLVKSETLSHDEAIGMLHIITQYTQSRILLNRFDTNTLEQKSENTEFLYRLESDHAYEAIRELKKDLYTRNEASELFALERKQGTLDNIIANIYQGFGGKDLYPSVEEKAVHLLYFVIKNHPFTDGNKRSAAFLFVLFLAKNGILYGDTGERRINNQSLVALTLLIAQSNDKDKHLMIQLAINMLLI